MTLLNEHSKALKAATATQSRPVGVGKGGAVAAVVLLAGAVRRARLHDVIGRSPLDLPIDSSASLLDVWSGQVARLAGVLSAERLHCRLMADSASSAPAATPVADRTEWSVETDPVELRGTGGLLRDIAECYGDDQYLVVASAMHLPLHPLERFVAEAVRDGVDVSVLEDLTGSPTSVFVIACRVLRELPAVGFVDLKEQALPQIARNHSVRVVPVPGPIAIPIRTASSYLAAVQARARRLRGLGDTETAFAERWRSDFAIAEPATLIDPTARLHNAVVLGGGMVEAGATIANCLVCPGGRVARGERLMNQVIAADGCFPIVHK